MKSIFIKITCSLLFLFTISCKSQTINDYINFYNGITPKLNSVAAGKAQYIGQNFSAFYTGLLNNNISINSIDYLPKVANSYKYYTLRLSFVDSDVALVGLDHEYQLPIIWVTFENEIPSTIKNMVLQHQGEWNNDFAVFFSMMKIESIKFTGINGYDNPDRTPK